ncbi:MAG: 4a-hydroxytetrahydrobiopterin dehydratase [bacterium]|nr:4a-hydroxytetrahydrobiopterin dehydratase [bacterium]
MKSTDWETTNNQLCKTFVFSSFPEAIAWMVKAAFVIEKANHHPNWSNVYNKVMVQLSTHDDGNIITQKDHDLAKALDQIA